MPKKRRSLQSLFSPSSPPQSPSDFTSRARSHSSAVSGSSAQSPSYFDFVPFDPTSSLPNLPLLDLPPAASRDSPPPDLLDDDPFADLSVAPSLQRSRPPSLDLTNVDNALTRAQQQPPRSPLSQSMSSDALFHHYMDASFAGPSSHSAPATSPPTPPIALSGSTIPRPRSSGHGQARPAYTRPAFTPRPSLPSLNTLAQSHVIVPKVRRGRVGAQLPLEPWNDVQPPSPRSPPRSPTSRRHLRRPTELSTIRDSRMILGGRSLSEWEDSAVEYDSEFIFPSSPVSSSSRVSPPPTSQLADESSADSSSSSIPSLASFSTESFRRSSLSPPPTRPSLCPSSPSPSESAERFAPVDPYPHAPFPRHSDLFASDLVASLEYNYADALAELTREPAAHTGLVLDAALFFGGGRCAELGLSTSPDTIRNVDAFARPVSELDAKWHAGDAVLPVSPGASEFTFSSSSQSCSSSGASSTDEDEDGEAAEQDEEYEGEYTYAPRASSSDDSHESFGVPWPSYSPGRTPSAALYSDEAFAEFDGDSTGGDADADDDDDDSVTARSPLSSCRSSRYSDGSLRSVISVMADEQMDAGEGGSRRADGNGRYAGGSAGYGGGYNGRSSANGNGSSSNGMHGNGRSGGFNRGRDEDDDDDGRGRRPSGARPPPPDYMDSETESETESESESSDTHSDGGARGAPTDDDVPLAQQIPTALTAQRTIRRQVRDEIDQRRAARTLRAQSASDRRDALARSARAAEPVSARTMSGTTAPAPASPSKPAARPRTKTLPGNTSNPISVGDLTKKLMGLPGAAPASPVLPAAPTRRRPSIDIKAPKPLGRAPSVDRGTGRAVSVARQPSRAGKDPLPLPPPPPPAAADDVRARALRPSRSLHRLNLAAVDTSSAPPVPVSAGPAFGRIGTLVRRRPSQEPLVPGPAARAPEEGRTSLERARSARPASRRPSVDRHEGGAPRARRPSMPAPAPAAAEPVLPAVAPARAHAHAHAHGGKAAATWQQRIFIGTMQRFCLVEIAAPTTAADVLQTVDSQGALEQGPGNGGWMLWEVSQDFGMERPIRSFELLADVCGSWNTDKIVNLLVIKKTLLAPLLSRANIPSSSPICSGYVQHEYKRGKWQKRWMELREHSIWLCKRESGKDQVFVCSLNNFDAYYVTRVHKAPKPYVFAVKSTDSLTFFEDTADYVHVFACGEGEGKNWLEKILLARSYIMYQERNVLSSTGATGLTRAGTRKQPPGQRPAQPLVSVGAPKSDVLAASASVEFEPGSLLAKRRPV